jgi:hypothetical protein
MTLIFFVHRSHEGLYAAWTPEEEGVTVWSRWQTTEQHVREEVECRLQGVVGAGHKYIFHRKQVPAEGRG